MNYETGDLPRRLADEYVLGSMKGRARRRFDALYQQHRSFRQAVRDAERRWNPLSDALTPVQPSAAVWENIDARINPARRSVDGPSVSSWWRLWAVAASLLVAVLLATPLWQPQQAREYVVVITHDVDARAGWLVSLQEGGERVKVAPLSSHVLPSERVFQLWVKAADAPRVESVGLISATGEIELPTQTGLQRALGNAVLFGVSVEPLGGSPTGQPTTEPLFHGKPRSI